MTGTILRTAQECIISGDGVALGHRILPGDNGYASNRNGAQRNTDSNTGDRGTECATVEGITFICHDESRDYQLIFLCSQWRNNENRDTGMMNNVICGGGLPE